MARRLSYPVARKADVVDDYHGVAVADPYRWLETPDDPETIAWVRAENALTRAVLDGPARDAARTRLETLFDYPRTSAPVARGSRFVFARNDGLQNQPVLYVQEGLDGRPRVLLDPNAIDPDGTTALTALSVDEAGERVAYALSQGGSDRQAIRVLDVATGQDRPDLLRWAKFASLTWVPDGTGFYYTRFPEPGSVPAADENYCNKVYFHRLGDDQREDTLVFERPDDREVVFQTAVTGDGRHLVITGFKGASERSEVHVCDRTSPASPPRPLFVGFDAAYHFIDDDRNRLYFRTDEGAARGRVIAVDREDPAPRAVEVVPESADTLVSAAIVHHQLVLGYLHDASTAFRLVTLDGTPVGEIALPAVGTVTEMTGRPGDDALFFTFTSFTHPPQVFRYDFTTRQLRPFSESPSTIDPSAYEIAQVWYRSKDGTPVSMFVVRRQSTARDGDRPTLLCGYGGFGISLTPAFDPARFAWLDRGGVFAVANLRGGGEYGEAWHEAGMLDRKQNVFDDFLAAAEWLIANGYTSARRLAIEGGSNGGLLVGAALVQRPDLFGAVICRVPVVDMLRYHLFTVGRFWIPEYGSSHDAQQFRVLHAYSPLHNVTDGSAYPATLVTTADTDDRVDPGMAKKFTARLQAASAGAAPILIRVETRAGHGAGKPVSKMIDEDADIFAFLVAALGMDGEA